MAGQGLLKSGREKGRTVSVALSFTDDDLMASGIEVLDAQSQAFEQSQPISVEQSADQRVVPFEMSEDSPDLLTGHDDGEPSRRSRPNGSVEADEFAPENLLV